MKSIFKLLFAAFLTVAPLTANAQSNVAHINVQQLISEMPEVIAAQELQKKQMDLMTPLLEKARNAITKVGEEQGFNYVIDSSPNGGIILANGKDLLADVKKELGF